jgi:hypothetical protein
MTVLGSCTGNPGPNAQLGRFGGNDVTLTSRSTWECVGGCRIELGSAVEKPLPKAELGRLGGKEAVLTKGGGVYPGALVDSVRSGGRAYPAELVSVIAGGRAYPDALVVVIITWGTVYTGGYHGAADVNEDMLELLKVPLDVGNTVGGGSKKTEVSHVGLGWVMELEVRLYVGETVVAVSGTGEGVTMTVSRIVVCRADVVPTSVGKLRWVSGGEGVRTH